MKIYKVTGIDEDTLFIDGTFTNWEEEYYTTSFEKAKQKMKEWEGMYADRPAIQFKKDERSAVCYDHGEYDSYRIEIYIEEIEVEE